MKKLLLLARRLKQETPAKPPPTVPCTLRIRCPKLRIAIAAMLTYALLACGGGGGGTDHDAAAASSNASSNTSSNTSSSASALSAAMRSGNASLLKPSDLITATQNVLALHAAEYNTTRQALFGLRPDSTAQAGSLTNIDWNPTHDSVYFSVHDVSRNRVVLPGNWHYSDNTAGASTGAALTVVGEAPLTLARYAAFGGNPLAARGNAGMDAFMANTIQWLTRRKSFAGLKIVTAHLPGNGSYWFPFEHKVNAWFAAQYVGVTINGIDPRTHALKDDICDGDKLAECLRGADLVVIGREQAPNRPYNVADEYPGAYNSDTIMSALAQAQANGVPLIYLHHGGDSNDLARHMLDYFGLTANDNYWTHEGIKAFNPATLPAVPAEAAAIGDLLRRLESGNFTTQWSGCVNELQRILCENTPSATRDDALSREFSTAGKAIRSNLRALDAKGFSLFSQPGYVLEKMLVLLGDTYRVSVSYPMTKTASRYRFFKAYFSDMTAYINRSSSAVARNLGNFSGLLTRPVALSRAVSVAPLTHGHREYMTGLYAMPGRTVTLTRTDSNASSVTFGLNMLRDTTQVYNIYDRPTMLASPRLPLIKDKTVTITSPFGGPILLFLSASAELSEVTVQVNGVTTHPVLQNVNDAAQVAAFRSALATTPTNWVGISTDFLSIHSNLPHFKTTMAAYGGDLLLLLNSVWTSMVKDTYELAGFNGANAGVFSLPATVHAFCAAAGWDCTGVQHRRDVMQHVIADSYADCGSGCSGNPYDQAWALDPMGWGETHEIGHNLQRERLLIYGGQSDEVSNNIFPAHKQMAANRATNPATPMTRDGTSARLGFDLIKTSLTQSSPSAYVKGQIWSDTGYAANNGLRLSFYRQLVEFARYYNPDTLSDGWELYTLLYLLERNLTASEATWSSAGATSPTPATKQVFSTYASFPSDMDGNDYMLIASSRIIGKDMRPVFAMWGVEYSAAAAAQLTAQGFATADKLLFPMNNVNAYGTGIAAPVNMTGSAVYPNGF